MTIERPDFVYVLWERDNTPYEGSTDMLELFWDKDRADEKCRELNDKANQDYQEELKYLRERWNQDTPTRGNYPRMSYHVSQYKVK